MGNKFGTVYQQLVTKTANYTVQDADDLVLVDATAGAVTITLPTPIGRYPGIDGRGLIRIMKIDQTANPVIVTPAAGTLLGQSELRDQQQSALYQSDGVASWYNLDPFKRTFTARIPLSAAQIIGMNATPVTLIPAPGAGRVIVVDNLSFKMIRTATAFVNGGALSFQYPTGPVAATATIAATVVTGGAGTVVQNVKGVEASLAAVPNDPIQITNATAAFATGTGTALVIIDYHVTE
jgi:hypothetical protein